MEFFHVSIKHEILKTIGSTLEFDSITPMFYRYLDIKTRTRIFEASMHDVNKIRQLFKFGVKSDLDQVLIKVCLEGYLDVAKFLIEQKADINARKNYSLRHAAACGRLKVVKFLIEQKADRSLRDPILRIIHARDNQTLKYASDIFKFLFQP